MSVQNAATCLQNWNTLSGAVGSFAGKVMSDLDVKDYEKFASDLIKNGETLTLDQQDKISELAKKINTPSEDQGIKGNPVLERKMYSAFGNALLNAPEQLEKLDTKELIGLEMLFADASPELAQKIFDLSISKLVEKTGVKTGSVRSFAEEAGIFTTKTVNRMLFKAEKFLCEFFNCDGFIKNLSYYKQTQNQSRSLQYILSVPEDQLTPDLINKCLLLGCADLSEENFIAVIAEIKKNPKTNIESFFKVITRSNTGTEIQDKSDWNNESWRESVLILFEGSKSSIIDEIAKLKNITK